MKKLANKIFSDLAVDKFTINFAHEPKGGYDIDLYVVPR